MESLNNANNAFALDLYRAMSESNPDSNLFFSPLNVSAMLGMIYLGARGTTAEEMAKVMSLSSVHDVHKHFKTLISEIDKPRSSYVLTLVNRLFGDNSFKYLPEFMNSIQNLYQAEIQTVDFINDPKQAIRSINFWIVKKTNFKLKDIMVPEMATKATRLILMNSIYFMGTWKEVFWSKETTETDFKLNQNETRPVQMMHQVKRLCYKYIPEYKLKVLELPYLQDELSMLVLLPDEAQDDSDPLQKLESEVTVDNLLKWTKKENMTTHDDIYVYLPKFKLTEQYSLEDILSKMGMSSLFQASAADLTGISKDKGLSLSSVVHKTFLDVNEKGIEELAPPERRCLNKSMRTRAGFVADHPFLFFIRHNSTNSILFMGRYRKPV